MYGNQLLRILPVPKVPGTRVYIRYRFKQNIDSNISITGSAQAGYTINIGNALAEVYIDGNLCYNGDVFLRKDGSEGNQIAMEEYINQMF